MYGERASPLPGAVVWWKHTTRDEPRRPVAPDGCIDLIWTGGQVLVAGPDTRPNYYEPPQPEPRYVGLRLPPGLGPLVLGVPAHELRDCRMPLADLWSAGDWRRLTETVAESTSPARALEAAASARLRRDEGVDPVVEEVVRRARAGSSVASIAGSVGMSERQLHRRCLPAFGYGAKTLTRILRMSRAVDLARAGIPFAAVAATSGYADQAHLARDVRALAGMPLGALVRAEGLPATA